MTWHDVNYRLAANNRAALELEERPVHCPAHGIYSAVPSTSPDPAFEQLSIVNECLAGAFAVDAVQLGPRHGHGADQRHPETPGDRPRHRVGPKPAPLGIEDDCGDLVRGRGERAPQNLRDGPAVPRAADEVLGRFQVDGLDLDQRRELAERLAHQGLGTERG